MLYASKEWVANNAFNSRQLQVVSSFRPSTTSPPPVSLERMRIYLFEIEMETETTHWIGFELIWRLPGRRLHVVNYWLLQAFQTCHWSNLHCKKILRLCVRRGMFVCTFFCLHMNFDFNWLIDWSSDWLMAGEKMSSEMQNSLLRAQWVGLIFICI